VELLANERIIWRGHPSWRSHLGFYLVWIPLALLPAIVAGVLDAFDKDTWLPLWQWILISVLLLIIVLAWDAIRRLAVTYTITNRRLHIRRGILSRRDQSTHIDRVQNLNTSQSLGERILHVGSVDFDTAGTGEAEADFRFRGVANPHGLVRRVEDLRRHLEGTPPGGV
jgi:uncharacterized membrane protein YdbT with pleckstrin-like domain